MRAPARQSVRQPRLSSRSSRNRAARARAPAGSRCRSRSTAPTAAPAAIAPAYAKSHSQGEYVFDHGWADAWERAGGRYYPKLQVAVPFTPAPGRGCCCATALAPALIAAIEAVTDQHKLSSAHATFVTPDQLPLFEAAGWLIRDRHAIPLAQPRLCELRRFPRRARQPQAQGDPQGARGGAVEGLTIRPSDRRCEITEAHWDAFWDFLSGHRQRANGAGPISPARILLAARRADGRQGAADPRRARRPADRRRAQPDRRRCALRPLLGLHRGSAVPPFRALLLPGDRRRDRARAGKRAPDGSRRARRASTSWRAAMCRCRPGRRTTSPSTTASSISI
jgi:hypothetical protein